MDDLDRVSSVREWRGRMGLSSSTAARILKSGNGPVITRLSDRRIGIRERDHRAWLDSRRNKKAGAKVGRPRIEDRDKILGEGSIGGVE